MKPSFGLRRAIFILIAFGMLGQAQVARLVPAPLIRLPGVADSNSPSHWTGGRLIVFNSDSLPVRSEGDGLDSLGEVRAVRFYDYSHVPLWLEATYKAPNGILYGWYHHEVFLGCAGNPVSAPEIGALRSDDDGLTFHDLGIVMRAAGEGDCSTKNKYFGGGNGDFSVIADAAGEYVYFYYSNYSGDTASQGVATARMASEYLDDPVGHVYKYFESEWQEPGLGGRETPVFAAFENWASDRANAFWGPSVHWNTYLNRYVMLLNYTCCSTDWPASGIYASFGEDLSTPASWKQPVMVLEGGGWYPMVMGLEEWGTDKLAGKVARFFMGSDSDWVIEFDWE